MEDTCSEKKTMQERVVLNSVSTTRLSLLEKRFTNKTLTKAENSKPKKIYQFIIAE